MQSLARTLKTILASLPFAVRAAAMPAAVLVALASAPAAAQLESKTPLVVDQLPRLEAALAHYHEIERHGGWKRLAETPAMGAPYSYDCKLLLAIEKRLVIEGYLGQVTPPAPRPPAQPEPALGFLTRKAPPPQPPPRCAYSAALTRAMRNFQADRYVLGDGQLGAKTRIQLNRPVGEIVDILEQDIARWRSVPLERNGTFLLVNIPFFELSAFEDGNEALRMPVVVGQRGWETPLFSDALEYIIVNPDWGIPEKIAKAEYWPSARRDPKWLTYRGISSEGGSLRQKPGPRNPLGRIKFVMPNEHDVYLHDTPEKGAFPAAVRALSHGCVRLSRPIDLANYLLRDQPEWNPQHMQTAIASGKTLHINLRRQMPVHIVYSMSRVNEAGRVELRPDVYGRNRQSRPVEEDAGVPAEALTDDGQRDTGP